MIAAMLLAAVVTAAAGSGPVASARSVSTAPGRAAPSSLRLLTEPDAGMAPIYDLVRSARSSVDMVMYELDDPTMQAALAGDAQRGVTVKVILDRNYVGSFNAPAKDYLDTHGVQVHWASDDYELTHEKSIVVDDRIGLVMTLNLGPVRYYATDRDFAVFDAQPADVAAMTTTFDADWSGAQISAPRGDDLLWSPGAEAPLVALIGSARETIAVENEEMADPEIVDALTAAAGRGVRVRVVMTASSEWDSAFSELARAGVEVRTYADSATGLYIHAKVVDVDDGERDARVFVGSQNFSETSLLENRELGILTSSPAVIAGIGRVLALDFADGTPWR